MWSCCDTHAHTRTYTQKMIFVNPLAPHRSISIDGEYDRFNAPEVISRPIIVVVESVGWRIRSLQRSWSHFTSFYRCCGVSCYRERRANVNTKRLELWRRANCKEFNLPVFSGLHGYNNVCSYHLSTVDDVDVTDWWWCWRHRLMMILMSQIDDDVDVTD